MRLWRVYLPTLLTIALVASSVADGADNNGRGVRRRNTGGGGGGGGYSDFDRIDIFTEGDMKLLEGIGMLFGIGEGDIASIVSLIKVGLGVVDLVDKIFGKIFNGSRFSLGVQPGSGRDMLAMFEVMSYRLDQMHMGIQGIESSLRNMARGLPHTLRWEVMLDSLEDYTRPLNSLHQRFVLYQKHRNQVENHTLLDFAESVVSHDGSSVLNLMANIHSMVAPDAPTLPRTMFLSSVGPEYVTVNNRVSEHYQHRYKESLLRHQQANLISTRETRQHVGELSLRPSIFIMLEQVLQSYSECDQQQSPQQMLLGLYSLVAITQARGYAMVNYAYMQLRIYGRGNFTVEQQLSRTLYEHYSRNTVRQALQVVARASNTYARCDPKEHVQGDTYVMFTELLQGHLENEVDLNSRGSCLNNCADYEHVRTQGCYMPDKQICGSKKGCRGTLHNCRFIDADADVCYSSSPYRRYEWLHYENGRVLGDKGSCRNLKKVDSWWRWFVHCSYCICLCDDPTSSTTDRYVSLLPTVTDTRDGMVLTGVKLSKHNKVLMLEVQQGRAMPQGQVDPSSLQWVAVPPIRVNSTSFVAERDYHVLTYEARNLDLDALSAPNNHVVTGTRFRMLGPHINLEIQVTPINFQTGKVNSNLSYWKSNDNTPVMSNSPRLEVQLFQPDDPSKLITPSTMDSTSDMFVQFQPTDLAADASQMTVPFFDAQPVTTSPASWISGLFLYHKGRRGSGGFVALQLECYNASRHFEDVVVNLDL